MRKIFVFIALFAASISMQAQSNIVYELRVAASRNLQLLDTMPKPYATEKVNVTLGRGYDLISDTLEAQAYDFILASSGTQATWEERYDSIYSYADGEETITVWQNNRVIKNKQTKVLRDNAYAGMRAYIIESTQVPSQTGAIIGWICAGLLLIFALVYLASTIHQRRKEQMLTSVEKETLRRKREDRRRHIFSQSYLWLILLVLYAPIALIAIFSFTESKILGNWTGFSTQLYLNLFSGKADAGLNSAILYTLIIAGIAAMVSTLLGTLAAIGIYNMRAKQRKVVTFLNSVPMINPDIITGISLFLLFVALGVSQGLWTVCIAHIVFCTPYVVLSVMPRLSRMNPNTYEAALDLGATPMQALRKVMLPELWPGMLSGFVLALTLSVDDFGVTFFTKGSGGLETLSTFIYSDARKGGLTPELRPLFTLILLVMLTVMIVVNIRAEKQENK